MSLATEAIAALDSALERAGSGWIVLRRTIGASNPVNIDCDVRAAVRSPDAEELSGGYDQTDSVVIMSPTQIIQAQWPGGQPVGSIHPEVPRGGGANADKAIIDGRTRKIEKVNAISIDNELVRIELRVLGPATS